MTATKKKAVKPAADGNKKYFSIATGKPVTAAYALRCPENVIEGVTELPKGAVIENAPISSVEAGKTKKRTAKTVKTPAKKVAKKAVKKTVKKAAKKTRIVKRNRKTGEFAKKTSHNGAVVSDFVTTTPRQQGKTTAVAKATKLTDAIGASTAALAKKRPGAKVAKKLTAAKVK